MILTPERIRDLWILAAKGEPRDVDEDRLITFANLVWEANRVELERQVGTFLDAKNRKVL